MTGNCRARFVHYLLMWHGSRAGEFCLRSMRCMHIVFALLESVPQHEAQHGLRRASGFAGKLYQAALLSLSENGLLHAWCSL